MKLDRALIISSMLVALSGIAALWLTFESALWLVGPAAVLVISAALRPAILSRLSIPQRALTPLVIGAFAFSVIDFFYIGGSLVAAGSDLMLILMCLKALTLRENKDFVQLYAAAFFLLLASTAISTDIYFVIPFAAFFIALTWALMLLTIKGEAETVSARPSRFSFGRGFFGGTALLTTASFVVTLAIFFIIPRVGIGFFSKRAGGLLRTSGFSDFIELGSMGEVKLDPTIVMRVRMQDVDEKPDFPLYWRGRTFDYYDGHSWSNTRRDWTPYYRVRGGDIYLAPGGRSGRTVEQEIALEPLDTGTLFALGRARMIRSDFAMVNVGQAGELTLPSPPGRRLHYTVVSELQPGEYSPDDGPGQEYLQLPEDSAAVTAAADEATAGVSDERGKAEAIIRYLANNERYTLDPPRNTALSPIDDFLTASKAGFCEHFATAMVLMLRAQGVQARMVSGFMGGQWNAYGSYFLVREQDAHTWVEAYMPGEGWTLFDPTPGSAGGGGTQASELGTFSRVFDYISYNWDRYIVYYNLRDQIALAGVFGDAYYEFKRELSDAFRQGGRKGAGGGLLSRLKTGMGIAGASAAGALVLAAGFMLWRIRRMRVRRAQGYRVGFYDEMLRLLKKRGYTKPPNRTPREFAVMMPAGAGRMDENVRTVTEAYYKVRYGRVELAADEEDAVRDALKRLKPGN